MQAHILLGQLPRDHILEPAHIVIFQTVGQLDAVLNADVTEVVDRQRDLIADHRTDFLDIVLQVIEALLGDVDTGEGMRDVVLVVGTVRPPARSSLIAASLGFASHLSGVMILIQETDRSGQATLDIPELVDAQVHLQHGVAVLLNALLQSVTHVQAGVLAVNVGIAVHTNLIAELTAEHLVNRNAVGLTGDIPQREFHAADAARLTGHTAELLDAAEDLVDVAGVLTDEETLEHLSIELGRAVADFTVTRDALVGLNAQQGAVHGGANDVNKTHVRDAKITGLGVRVDMGKSLFKILGHCFHPP